MIIGLFIASSLISVMNGRDSCDPYAVGQVIEPGYFSTCGDIDR